MKSKGPGRQLRIAHGGDSFSRTLQQLAKVDVLILDDQGLGHAISVASMIGLIALGGVAAEFGVIMLFYLRHAWEQRLAAGEPPPQSGNFAGCHQHVRPKAMTVAVILAGLFSLFIGTGAGS